MSSLLLLVFLLRSIAQGMLGLYFGLTLSGTPAGCLKGAFIVNFCRILWAMELIFALYHLSVCLPVYPSVIISSYLSIFIYSFTLACYVLLLYFCVILDILTQNWKTADPEYTELCVIRKWVLPGDQQSTLQWGEWLPGLGQEPWTWGSCGLGAYKSEESAWREVKRSLQQAPPNSLDGPPKHPGREGSKEL